MSAQFKHCSNTVFKLCQTRTNCLNSVQTAHHRTAGCSNTVRTHGNECITCPNTVWTVFGQHAKQHVMFKHFEQCSNSTPLHSRLFEHGLNTWKRMYNMSEHCPNSVRTAREAAHDVRTLRTVFEHCQTRTNCSKSVRTHGSKCRTCPNTVRTVFGQHTK